MKKTNYWKILITGLLKENPVFVLILGTCPTLAMSNSVTSAVGMGLAATAVLICSNAVVSLLRKFIPDSVRIPCYIVVIAGFVTLVEMFIHAYLPDLYESLGVFLALITVNCIILGRAESYASKNPVIPSIFDGIGMGLGFTVGLTSIGIVRELIGAGTAFGFQIMPASYEPVTIFILAPGAFFVLSCLVAAQNYVKAKAAKKGKEVKPAGGCGEGCGNCGNTACGGKVFPTGNEE